MLLSFKVLIKSVLSVTLGWFLDTSSLIFPVNMPPVKPPVKPPFHLLLSFIKYNLAFFLNVFSKSFLVLISFILLMLAMTLTRLDILTVFPTAGAAIAALAVGFAFSFI